MRYGFNQESISFVNRTMDVVASAGALAERYQITDKAAEERFNRSMGGSSTYGYDNLTLLSALWTTADINTDWGGDSEGIYEVNGDWPWIAKAWQSTITPPAGDFPTNESDKKMEDMIHDAIAIVTEVENKIWLAILVTGAIRNLEGDCRNVWDMYPQIQEEFKKERDEAKDETKRLFSSNPRLLPFVAPFES